MWHRSLARIGRNPSAWNNAPLCRKRQAEVCSQTWMDEDEISVYHSRLIVHFVCISSTNLSIEQLLLYCDPRVYPPMHLYVGIDPLFGVSVLDGSLSICSSLAISHIPTSCLYFRLTRRAYAPSTPVSLMQKLMHNTVCNNFNYCFVWWTT